MSSLNLEAIKAEIAAFEDEENDDYFRFAWGVGKQIPAYRDIQALIAEVEYLRTQNDGMQDHAANMGASHGNALREIDALRAENARLRAKIESERGEI